MEIQSSLLHIMSKNSSLSKNHKGQSIHHLNLQSVEQDTYSRFYQSPNQLHKAMKHNKHNELHKINSSKANWESSLWEVETLL